MKLLRAPDDRFAACAPFAPHYLDVRARDGESGPAIRMHYLDEGPRDAPPVLLLHGEPTWSYLWRRLVPALAGAGLRAIAPDLVGFGRSDKPASRDDHTYARHVGWMAAFVEALDLRDVTLVCHDWGGLIGLRVAAERGERFARVLASNTFLPTGDERISQAFLAWQQFSQSAPHLRASDVVELGSATALSPETKAAYDAPFPDESYNAGPRAMPMLVPTSPVDPASDDNRRAWAALERWTKPFLTAFGDKDPITEGADAVLQARIPGAKGQAHVTLEGAGHFVQEDAAAALERAVLGFAKAGR